MPHRYCSYGTPDEFKAFVNEAHHYGMGVILDFVPNHLSSQTYLMNFDGPRAAPPFDTATDVAEQRGPYFYVRQKRIFAPCVLRLAVCVHRVTLRPVVACHIP